MEEDTSGFTFQEWTPDVDTSSPPVPMMINSSELRTTGFNLKEVFPPELEVSSRVSTRFTLKISIFPINLVQKKKYMGGVSDTPTTMRMKTLFRPFLDHHDRGINLYLLCTIISEEGGDGESTDSESSSLLSYILRFVILTGLVRLCQFGLR